MGEYCKFASVEVNERLGDLEAQPDAFAVELGCPEELAEHVAKLALLDVSHASAVVLHMHPQQALVLVVADKHANEAEPCEFECVLQEVDQDLLEPCVVSIKRLGQLVDLIFDVSGLHGVDFGVDASQQESSDEMHRKLSASTFQRLQVENLFDLVEDLCGGEDSCIALQSVLVKRF